MKYLIKQRNVLESSNFDTVFFGTFVSFYDNNRNSPNFPTYDESFSGNELDDFSRNLFIYGGRFSSILLISILNKLKIYITITISC